jgi:hypothetical protein
MEYFLAVLIIIFMWATPIVSAILKVYTPLVFICFGLLITLESYIIGLGGIIGCLININFTKSHWKKSGQIPEIPLFGIKSSYLFIVGVLLSLILLSIFSLKQVKIIDYMIIFILSIYWIVAFGRNVWDKVKYFKVVEKYDTDPKWATYLIFEDGREQWNEAKSNSLFAKDPNNDDMTFVHLEQEHAINYAKRTFKNAELID